MTSGGDADARYRAYNDARDRARMAAARVEISSRWDGSYERAVADAKLAAAQAEAHKHALEHGGADAVVPVTAAVTAAVTPIVVRCNTSPAHISAASVSGEDRLPNGVSAALKGSATFGSSPFTRAVRGMDKAQDSQQRTSRYLEAIKVDLQRNVRFAQQRYQKAALPEERKMRSAQPGSNVDALYWP